MENVLGGLISIALGIWLATVASTLCTRPVPFLGWLTLKDRSGFPWFLRAVYLLPLLGGLGIMVAFGGGGLVHEHLPESWQPFVVLGGLALGVSAYLIEKKTALLSAVSKGNKIVFYFGLALAFTSIANGLPEPPAQNQNKELTCRESAICWGEKHRIKAETRCTRYIERMAYYGVEWTTGFLGDRMFYYWGWATLTDTSTLVYRGDSVKLQNRFGAYIPHIYTCYYKPDTETVVNVNLVEGRSLR